MATRQDETRARQGRKWMENDEEDGRTGKARGGGTQLSWYQILVWKEKHFMKGLSHLPPPPSQKNNNTAKTL